MTAPTDPTDPQAKRIEHLEIKLSYMEDLLDELNLAVYRQREQIDRMAVALVQMHEREAARGSDAPRSLRDELPPHY